MIRCRFTLLYSKYKITKSGKMGKRANVKFCFKIGKHATEIFLLLKKVNGDKWMIVYKRFWTIWYFATVKKAVKRWRTFRSTENGPYSKNHWIMRQKTAIDAYVSVRLLVDEFKVGKNRRGIDQKIDQKWRGFEFFWKMPYEFLFVIYLKWQHIYVFKINKFNSNYFTLIKIIFFF